MTYAWCNNCKDVVDHEFNGIYDYKCKKCGIETSRAPSPEFNDKNATLLWYRNLHKED